MAQATLIFGNLCNIPFSFPSSKKFTDSALRFMQSSLSLIHIYTFSSCPNFLQSISTSAELVSRKDMIATSFVVCSDLVFYIVLVFRTPSYSATSLRVYYDFVFILFFVVSKSIVFIATSLRVYSVCGPISFPQSLNISPFILCFTNYLVFTFFGRLQVSRYWRDKCCRRKRNGP